MADFTAVKPIQPNKPIKPKELDVAFLDISVSGLEKVELSDEEKCIKAIFLACEKNHRWSFSKKQYLSVLEDIAVGDAVKILNIFCGNLQYVLCFQKRYFVTDAFVEVIKKAS